MTALLSILNKSAVAMAADSAVTLSSQETLKTFNTVNKLFNLNKYSPIGIMIYNNANFMEVPWETVIKIFRAKNLNSRYKTIGNAVNYFIEFLQTSKEFYPIESQIAIFEKNIKNTFSNIYNDLLLKIGDINSNNPNSVVSPTGIVKITNDIIDKYYAHYMNLKYYDDYNEDDKLEIINRNIQYFDSLINYFFPSLMNDIIYKSKLYGIAACRILKSDFTRDYSTGIVIGGFGENEFYPAIQEIKIDIVYKGKLKYNIDTLKKISNQEPSFILPYAQKDMALTFLDGIYPKLKFDLVIGIQRILENLSSNIGKIPEIKKLNITDFEIIEKKVREYSIKSFQNFYSLLSEMLKNEHNTPLHEAVAYLPKEELASMAESLVYLTYMKKRFSVEAETVGGAIDVAVITKGDGFIWIKRKHYFQSEFNPHFFKNYFK